MKKAIVLSVLTLLVYRGLFSQNIPIFSEQELKGIKPEVIIPYTINNSYNQANKTSAPVDTAGLEFTTDQRALFFTNVQNVSFPLIGSNPFLDKEFAQIYPNWNSLSIEQVLLCSWRVITTTVSPNATINVNVYNTSNSTPSTILTTKSLLLSDIDSGIARLKYTVVNLNSPVNVNAEFAVGIDVSTLYNTSNQVIGLAGFWATGEDQPNASLLARIKDANNTWTPFYEWAQQHGLQYEGGVPATNSNFLFLPVVASAYNTSIDKVQAVNGIKLNAYIGEEKIRIDYEIAKAENVKVKIIDATGKIVYDLNEGIKPQGLYSIELIKNSFAPGTYFYYLQTNTNNSIAKKIIVD